MDRKSRLAPVTCSSMGGDGIPEENMTDSGYVLFFAGLQQIGLSLTCWIFNSQDLCRFTWVTNSGLVLSPDLELDFCSLNDICHPVFTIWTRSLSTFHPACSKLLLLLNGVPGWRQHQKMKTLGITNSTRDCVRESKEIAPEYGSTAVIFRCLPFQVHILFGHRVNGECVRWPRSSCNKTTILFSTPVTQKLNAHTCLMICHLLKVSLASTESSSSQNGPTPTAFSAATRNTYRAPSLSGVTVLFSSFTVVSTACQPLRLTSRFSTT